MGEKGTYHYLWSKLDRPGRVFPNLQLSISTLRAFIVNVASPSLLPCSSRALAQHATELSAI